MDNEISFENSRAFREFMAKIDRQNREILNVCDSEERRRSFRLNLKLTTVNYSPPTWYWRDWVEDQVKEGGESC